MTYGGRSARAGSTAPETDLARAGDARPPVGHDILQAGATPRSSAASPGRSYGYEDAQDTGVDRGMYPMTLSAVRTRRNAPSTSRSASSEPAGSCRRGEAESAVSNKGVRSPRTRIQVSTWTFGETIPSGTRGSLEAPFATAPGTGTGPAASRPSSDTNEGEVPRTVRGPPSRERYAKPAARALSSAAGEMPEPMFASAAMRSSSGGWEAKRRFHQEVFMPSGSAM